MNLWDLISSVIGNMQVNTRGLGKWIDGHLKNVYSLMTMTCLTLLILGGFVVTNYTFFEPHQREWLLGNTILCVFFVFWFSWKNYQVTRTKTWLDLGNKMIEQMCSDPTTIKIQTSILSDTIHPKKRVELVVQKEQEGHVATLSVGDNIVRKVLLDKT